MKILEIIFKKLTICLIFLLFTMNVYSAVVSDSDGNSFVTKQEFETYKEKFNKQIDQYNRSIDSKIDGAISSYLDGISYTRVEVLNNCTSLLKYPLNIYMNSKYYFDIDKYKDELEGYVWEPNWSWKFVCNWWWGTVPVFATWSRPDTDNINNKFYSISTDLSGNDYVSSVLNVNNNVINFNGFGWNEWTETNMKDEYVRQSKASLLVLASKNWPASQTYWSVSHTYSFPDDYSISYKLGDAEPTSAPFQSGICINWAQTKKPIVKKTTLPYDTVDDAGSGGALWIYPRTNAADFIYSSIETENSNITDIINGRKTKTDYVQTMHSGIIYLTNQNNKRRLLKNEFTSGNERWYNASDWGASNDDISVVVSPGFILEPDGEGNATRDKHNKSLWKIDDINYDVNCPLTGDKERQNMRRGILLTELPDKELDYIYVSVDCNFSSTISPKIAFSNAPIDDISDQTVIDNCYNISLTEKGPPAKTVSLNNGKNRIYLRNSDRKSKLYYKIQFDEESAEKVTINEPIVTISYMR